MVTTSGKELELKPIKRKQAVKFKIAAVMGYAGFDVYYDAALTATGLTMEEFEKTYDDNDIMEIAGEVFKMLTPTEEQKKS